MGDTVEAEVADTRAAALAARDAGGDDTMSDLVGEWRSRLRWLVADDPRVVDDLRRLLADLSSTGATVDGSEIGSVSMRITASGHSRVTLAGRDVHVTEQ